MDIRIERKIIAMLRVLKDARRPLGSTKIAEKIENYGINLSQRTVRYYLAITDRLGLTRNLGRRGREITPAGEEELKSALVIDKVGLIASKIDTISYKLSFSPKTLRGDIILNISLIDKEDFKRSLKYILPVLEKRLGMGEFIVFQEPENQLGEYYVPPLKMAIGTICSVTINGILLNYGIPVRSRFGGLLEMRDGEPLRFTEIISYDGSSLDPLEIFIKGNMTTVNNVVLTGNGLIGASFREIPAVSIAEVNKIRKKLDQIGLGGILIIGKPGQNLLDISVHEGRAGMVVFGGLNPLAAVEEKGIKTQNLAMGTLYEFKKMKHLSSIKKGETAP
ncbi:MAG TPA: NrpR regulatory domain-containing protein [Nitrospinota bacterium]|nr:NrpR regulatory domain-containing protein [Nitrospinota bacterium]